MLPLMEKTRGQDVYSACKTYIKAKRSPIYKLVLMTTDGAPSMTGKNNAFLSLYAQMMMTLQISFIATALFTNRPSVVKFLRGSTLWISV
jgi:hypothetical protein